MLILLLCLVALVVGSLLNVIIYRLPIMLQTEWKTQCRELLNLPAEASTEINLFLPRSYCRNCKNTIRAWQNIPILSFIFLRGRCYYCGTGISYRYPIVEFLSLALSILAYIKFGFTLPLLFALLFIWIILVLFFIDLDEQILPDNLTLSLLWVGLIANTENLFTSLPIAIYAAILGYLSLWLFIKIFYLITGKIGMGHGDFKLVAAFGAWFGWWGLPFILLVASITGAIIGAIALSLQGKGRETPIPFGPFLCTAGLIYLFAGKEIWHWYLGFFG